MREISVDLIRDTVARLAIEACCHLPETTLAAMRRARERELSPTGRDVLDQLIQNAGIAASENVPICQDTGLAVVFADIGQDVHITGGLFEDAVNQGIAKGYTEGYLRKSVVAEPIFNRVNTQNNTPGVIYTKIVPGDKLKITVEPKGFGSENKGGIKMLVPADGLEGVKKAVMEIILHASMNPCPPMVVGIGIGGTMDRAAVMSKIALTRSIDSHNPMPEYAKLEDDLLELINETGIGPQLGGTTSCLGVNIEWGPTHIAGLPVAVTICCHACRHKTRTL